ncbi:MAG: membrane protein insertion efficiency factor YidD [Lewinellaceae bacterium]|nr:membrane protein insertion efficiency factor YidD [Saprospiraceae bacterium]MCB9315077.1 membrane protein insertion efficiency factor YidD [Lewinellaceae bacterium]MCB9329864.1 membrane protein insertion efficiency factor YidD [Lewinellaceae bacterium]
MKKFIRYLFTLPIRLYQVTLSPLLGGSKCRFQPTCSNYAIQAIEEWGIFKGTYLAARRILRCHPWGGFGPDPVPKRDKTTPGQ